jgi:hypothetical protein
MQFRRITGLLSRFQRMRHFRLWPFASFRRRAVIKRAKAAARIKRKPCLRGGSCLIQRAEQCQRRGEKKV